MNAHQIQTVAIPNISTGVYAFPKVLAAHIAIKTILENLKENPSIERVDYYCFEDDNFQIYKETLSRMLKN
jgi:O-acetyl-ADP-ribose deacetylase (regulator of RNase III)